MKLIGDLKKQVDNANSIEEKRQLIENAGMALTDDELNNVSGGTDPQEVNDCASYIKGSKGGNG